MKKDKGSETFLHSIIIIVGLMITLIILTVILNLQSLGMMKTEIEDEMVNSSLTASVMDISNVSATKEVNFLDVDNSYKLYKYSFMKNLNLEEKSTNIFEPVRGTRYFDKITNIQIENVTFYECRKNVICVYSYNKNGSLSTYEISYDNAKSPDGTKITRPSVYAKTSFTYIATNKSKSEATREVTTAIDYEITMKE